MAAEKWILFVLLYSQAVCGGGNSSICWYTCFWKQNIALCVQLFIMNLQGKVARKVNKWKGNKSILGQYWSSSGVAIVFCKPLLFSMDPCCLPWTIIVFWVPLLSSMDHHCFPCYLHGLPFSFMDPCCLHWMAIVFLGSLLSFMNCHCVFHRYLLSSMDIHCIS